jgi:hypothetical protein
MQTQYWGLFVYRLRLALAIRELVAEGPAFGRSEVAVMWAIVAWCRHWVMPSNERATLFLAEAPWCVERTCLCVARMEWASSRAARAAVRGGRQSRPWAHGAGSWT